jgi:hypothetical protein
LECITGKLTEIRIETEARIDLYIQDIKNRGINSEVHQKFKEMINTSLRSEKPRLGMWEIRDIEELSEIDAIKNASENEINQIRIEIENLNNIYYQGCRKLISEKMKMDWKERNPNYKIDKKSNNYRKAFGCKKKNKGKKKYKMSVNEVLKTERIVKCRKRKDKDENDKKSTKKGKKEMNEGNTIVVPSRIKINRKNANSKAEAICDVIIGIRRKYDDLININDIEGRNKGKRAKTRKKKENE